MQAACAPQENMMQAPTHDLTALFEQLGLPADQTSQDAFIDQHAPLPEKTHLADAAFWSPAQASLLHQQIAADDDWAEVVDQLNLLLRRTC
ncbi:MAG: hypothetical protein ACI9EB_001693 [Pseudomonas sp.]|jgi:hypothetical protein